MIIKFLLYFIGSVIFLKAFVFIYERKLIYFPQKKIEVLPTAYNLKYEDVYFTTEDGIKLNGWFIKNSDTSPVLLFFHGNAGNMCHRLDNVKLLINIGLSVFIVDYRGYGLSEGAPSEKGIYIDGLASYKYLTDIKKIKPENIVIFGRSLGGCVAVDLASKVESKCLIVESTFTNSVDMSKKILPFIPAKIFITVMFDNIKKIQNVKVPKLFIHGNKDSIIPFKLGKKLFEGSPEPKEFYEIPFAGHNNTYSVGGSEYFMKFKKFINEVK